MPVPTDQILDQSAGELPGPAPAPRRLSRTGLALTGVAAFLLVLAPLLHWYALPNLRKTPIDTNTTTVFTGTGTVFDTKAVAVSPAQDLTLTRRVVGNVALSGPTRAVMDISTQIDTAATLGLHDPRKSVQWTVERWVTDRSTNLPLHSHGESPVFSGEAYLKFPFGLAKRPYAYWDSTLGSTVTLDFQGTTTVKGRTGYRYGAVLGATKVGTQQVPGKLLGLADRNQVVADRYYANGGFSVVVDPVTGTVMDARTQPLVTLRTSADGPDLLALLRADLTMTAESRDGQVRTAQAAGRKLGLVGTTAPVAAGTAGIVCLLAAGVLLRRRASQ
ncbi:porin PorA family protein [Streptomyces antarcticus]|uniref:porin PorA family protein n=1 Tax=Streptomyces antarcticus TaxID=2996458 RepID=UPI00226FE8E5|nr:MULTISPECIES: porin PorA family protein [unclassified Streptomyces]MCY0943308.1 porin PorA family protein [Streptomyces sp. H34-AA3]MCZ4082503.1 porin PorA family protein [Streptomyces sp. H34-S5]